MIINKTPHDVTIVDYNNNIINTMKSSGQIRLAAITKKVGTINNVPISKTEFGEPEGLPEFKKDRYYIVSQLVKKALPNRTDLLVPAELVRDDNGNIIGCRSLGI